jgi:Spy/CpxP family protein refolding chaperone
MKTRFSATLSRTALVATLALASAFAAAQPMTGAERGGKMHAFKAGGEPDAARFAMRLEMMKTKLNLNATQEAQFNTAREATKAAVEAGRAARVNARGSAQAELAKADPDLGALLIQRELVKEANAGQRKVAVNEWAKFLSLLNTEQKAIVKSQLLNRMSRAPRV